MTLKIDRVGRIIIPKQVRERLGFRAGTILEIKETEEGLLLTPSTEKPSMIKVDGFWIHQGVAPEQFDWNRIVEDDRDERMKKVGRM